MFWILLYLPVYSELLATSFLLLQGFLS